MHIVRYAGRNDGTSHVGIRVADGALPLPVTSMGSLLSLPRDTIREMTEAADGPPARWEDLIALPPGDGLTEVWAAGVTYLRSKNARMEESSQSDVYDRVYEADRPELFFKAVPWRTVTDDEPIAIRRDSFLNVPEAELAVVANADGEILGYTICNDVSSRTIEGDNPLYLPQAKIYAGACALGSGIRPSWEVDLSDATVSLLIERSGSPVWEGSTSTAQMRRSPEELIEYAFREEQFPHGAIISTGTGIVPELDFSLAVGDVVRIAIDQIGSLTNHVVSGKASMAWLVDSIGDPRARLR